MPPPVATLLKLGFIVLLFRRDIRERPEITNALWLPLYLDADYLFQATFRLAYYLWSSFRGELVSVANEVSQSPALEHPLSA